MLNPPTAAAPLRLATEIVSILNNAETEVTKLHAGSPGATTAEIEAQLDEVSVAQLRTNLAAFAQKDPAKHAKAQEALA